MKVFVLGHGGMLGHVALRFFKERGCQVVISPFRYQGVGADPLIEAVRNSGCTWIVNALGRIKQKTEEPGELYLANTVFPIHLATRMRPEQRLIHASSDCIFSGDRGPYKIDAERDATDVYGLSKALGEAAAKPDRCWVIRTSIIGPDQGKALGLMGWFLAQSKDVNGYTNHLWNGITTLDWNELAWELMQGKIQIEGSILQAGTWPAKSKCEVLKLIGKTWNHDVKVNPTVANEAIDRSLIPTVKRSDLETQLAKFKAWYV